MRKCGNCGETGHNRRTCKSTTTKVPAVIIEEDDGVEIVCDENWNPIKEKKKVVRCRSCGEKDDHTAKNCPYKPIPEGADIGPKLMECGHFSWWHRNGECGLCSKAVYHRHLNEEQEAA